MMRRVLLSLVVPRGKEREHVSLFTCTTTNTHKTVAGAEGVDSHLKGEGRGAIVSLPLLSLVLLSQHSKSGGLLMIRSSDLVLNEEG